MHEHCVCIQIRNTASHHCAASEQAKFIEVLVRRRSDVCLAPCHGSALSVLTKAHDLTRRSRGLHRAVLCCAVLCCAVPCRAVLCCAVPCCAVRCCAVVRQTVLHHTKVNTKQIIAMGADVHAVARDGNTALHMAASCSRRFCVTALLRAKASPNKRNALGEVRHGGIKWLRCPRTVRCTLRVRRLVLPLHCSPAMFRPFPVFAQTPLHLATTQRIVKALVRHNADPNIVDLTGSVSIKTSSSDIKSHTPVSSGPCTTVVCSCVFLN